MREIHFGRWAEVLAQTKLPERQKQSLTVTIRWYLSFCRRGRAGVTVQSARDFVEWAQSQKQRSPWQVEEWKNALRWFFKSAPRPAGSKPGAGQSNQKPAVQPQMNADQRRTTAAPPGLGVPDKTVDQGTPGTPTHWKEQFLTVVRRRKYSYRTEQSYLVWIERFVRHVKTSQLESLGTEAIKAFLDSMALNEQLSASSQRQALHPVR
jgi:hypothetical protein